MFTVIDEVGRKQTFDDIRKYGGQPLKANEELIVVNCGDQGAEPWVVANGNVDELARFYRTIRACDFGSDPKPLRARIVTELVYTGDFGAK